MFLTEYSPRQHEFGFLHRFDKSPELSAFQLHSHHDTYEIIVFMQGNCSFHVEGTIYHLKQNDILITQCNEMHVMRHSIPAAPYERIAIEIPDRFFIQNNCEELKGVFTSRPLGVNNLISAESVEQYKIPEIIQAMKRYCQEQDSSIDIVMKSKLIELLYNLKQISVKSETYSFHHERIKEIIIYINDNLTSHLSLDMIAEHFFVSKYHLCHIFKQQTGLTVNKYISHKRIHLVQELYSQGMPLIHASAEAGFENYSTFHKMYIKEVGRSPKADMMDKSRKKPRIK